MKYLIGIDFGTLSARAILTNETGDIISQSSSNYAHGVMDGATFGTNKPSCAIQHPDDYIEALSYLTRKVVADSGVDVSDIVGIGIDFTSCTVLPVDDNEVPVCKNPAFDKDMHAYVKLWKHHGGEKYADKMQEVAIARGESWLNRYGGKISCEFALPKIIETLNESPSVWSNTARFVEAGDWIVGKLIDKKVQSGVFSGYKWCWEKTSGYPSNDYLVAVDDRLDGIVGGKILDSVTTDTSIGTIGEYGSKLTGLKVGTAVSIPVIDAHSALPALGAVGEGDMMLIIGTSGCQIVNSAKQLDMTGVFGWVKDSIIQGLYTYEAGQTAVGDIFEWVVNNFVTDEYRQEAKSRGINIHAFLRQKASSLKVGESGLICLDWLNGNRSILNDASLKGAIFGLTLDTKPEEVYRAFIEATAFGVKVIVDNYRSYGIEISNIFAGGGIAKKDPLLMQIYADVLDMPIIVPDCDQAGALGSAIYGAVASGLYGSVSEASKVMQAKNATTYTPIEQNAKAYSIEYLRYKSLHDVFSKREA